MSINKLPNVKASTLWSVAEFERLKKEAAAGNIPFLADDAELIEATPHRAILALLLNVLTSTAALAHAAGEIHGPEDYAEFVGLVTRHLIDAADPEFQAELRRVIDNNG